MATSRPWAPIIVGAFGTASAASITIRLYAEAALAPSPALELAHASLNLILLGITAVLACRMVIRRRTQTEITAADLTNLRSALGLVAADVERIDKNLEVLTARTGRLAHLLETEVSVPGSDQEVTGDIVLMPRHRKANGARFGAN